MINIKIAIILILFFSSAIGSAAEDIVFCDSVQSQAGGWSGNFTLPKFDPNLGSLKEVKIAMDVNLSQRVGVENTGPENSTINSTTQSVLIMLLPDDQEIKANTSLAIFRDLQPFDGVEDFSGPSGMDFNESTSGGTVTYSIKDISDFVAGSPGENVQLNAEMKRLQNTSISGSGSSQVRIETGASVCVTYRYDRGAS